MVNQDYLPYIIALSVVELILVVALLFYRYYRSQKVTGSQDESTPLQSYFSGLPFESVYRSRYKRWGYIILTTMRMAYFLLYLGFGVVRKPRALYFTQWNVCTIIIYFLLASIASVIGIIYDPNIAQGPPRIFNNVDISQCSGVQWSVSMLRFGYSLQIMFETMGATALYITVVVFLLLNRSGDFFNMKDHLITTIGYLLDMYLSGMVVRWEHLPFMLLWAMLYLIYIWSTVASGIYHQWPYFFLSSSSAVSLGVYTGLFIALGVVYSIWYGISYMKELYSPQIYGAHIDEAVGDEAGSGTSHSPLPQKEPREHDLEATLEGNHKTRDMENS